jgi:hypothetical protein
MKITSVRPEFVESMPSELEQGILYISIRYRTAGHLCACGCRRKVVTPIKPAKWHLAYDGDTVSLWPSIGNWQFECQSHYWIEENKVRWCGRWTSKQVAEGRTRDARALNHYYKGRVEEHRSPVGRWTRARLRVFRLLRKEKEIPW